MAVKDAPDDVLRSPRLDETDAPCVVLPPPPPVKFLRKLLSVLTWLSSEGASWAMVKKSSMTSCGGITSGQVTSCRVS